MATQLRIKRGTTNANAPSGLTAGEMAINLVDKKLYVGGTAGTNVIFLDSTSSVGLGTANTFTALNSFNAGISASGATFSGPIQIPINTAPAITIGNDATRNLTLSSITRAGEIVQTGAANATLNIRQESGGVVSIGDYAENLNSTFISVDDSNTSIALNGSGYLIALNPFGIQINGTISTPLVLANAESIQNTTNGRIDFMPGPTGGTAYGLYADVANWGYGVQMGTINSAGTIDSSPGGILFMDRVTFLQDKFIGFASDGSHGLVYTTQGLNTLQIGVYPGGTANSNAVAIVETNSAGTANRSPVTSHTNPNLYIYRAGATSANDFIRIEHDGTNGNIVAGGTSGIKISGLLDVASGLSTAGATFSGDITVNSMTVGRGGGGDYRNTAVGNGALLQNTGIGNAGMGTYALGANTSGSNKTAIGYAAGYYRGSGVSTLTTGTGGIYIGYQARGSADTQTNEIVIGVDALGLGSNTAVIGATTQSAATVYGVLNLPSGLSASGATFTGPIISTGYQISSGAINAQTASYSLVAGDNGKIVTMNVASANNLTVPASLAVGFNCTVIQLGAGQTTILASGTTLNSYQGYLKISGQHGSASIVGYTSNVYNVAGNLSA